MGASDMATCSALVQLESADDASRCSAPPTAQPGCCPRPEGVRAITYAL